MRTIAASRKRNVSATLRWCRSSDHGPTRSLSIRNSVGFNDRLAERSRNPRGDDLGEIREGHFGELADGSVTLCNHKGVPEGRLEIVGENEQPAQAAWRLLREQFEKEDRSDDFWSPLGKYWVTRV